MVAGAMLGAAMEAMANDEPELVYQAATGDSNPNDMKRIVGLVGLYKREHFKEKDTGNSLVNRFHKMVETSPATQKAYERTSTPMLNTMAKAANSMLDRVTPEWGAGRIGDIVTDVKKGIDEFERTTQETMDAFAMFKPFMVDNEYNYRSENVRDLMARVKKSEKHLLPWSPDKIDWYEYWLKIHFPGLRKWVLPQLEEDLKAIERRDYTYKDLADLFDTATKRFPTRVSMKIERNGRMEQYTYEDVRELALRAAGFLADKGIKQDDRVILFSHNMPEWGLTYFGIIKAGATAIPIDPASSVDEIISFAKAGEASAIVISPKLLEENPELKDRFKKEKLTVEIFTFEDVFEMPAENEEAKRLALLPNRIVATSPVSLIFTSGTTGTPKAVMLSHKNFTSMVSMLSSVLEMSVEDGILSVLPMHHTFEFSAGFLTPFTNGTQMRYLEELSSDELSKAIENGHVTGMVGVPALWEMLHRRIKNTTSRSRRLDRRYCR